MINGEVTGIVKIYAIDKAEAFGVKRDLRIDAREFTFGHYHASGKSPRGLAGKHRIHRGVRFAGHRHFVVTSPAANDLNGDTGITKIVSITGGQFVLGVNYGL